MLYQETSIASSQISTVLKALNHFHRIGTVTKKMAFVSDWTDEIPKRQLYKSDFSRSRHGWKPALARLSDYLNGIKKQSCLARSQSRTTFTVATMSVTPCLAILLLSFVSWQSAEAQILGFGSCPTQPTVVAGFDKTKVMRTQLSDKKILYCDLRGNHSFDKAFRSTVRGSM